MKQKLKKCVVLLLCTVLLCGIPVQAADENVKVSDVEYAISLNKAARAFIGNSVPVSGVVGSKVFLTYTVEKITENKSGEDGVVAAMSNTSQYPYTNGGMRYWGSGSKLFEEGWTYVYRFERTVNGFEYTIVKMKDDLVRTIEFTKPEGTPDGKYEYFGIWTGGLAEHYVTGVLSHVRCYDENGNDLGISTNRTSLVTARTAGEPEDYADVAEGYYCEANDTTIVLHANKKANKITGNAKDEVSYNIFYDTQLTLQYKSGKEIYERDYWKLVDEDGNEYMRLKPVKVTFVTTEGKTVQEANVENCYRITEPAVPTREGATFKGWYLGNNTAYEFGKAVTKSITLYAKWVDADGNEYIDQDIKVDADAKEDAKKAVDYAPYIAVGASVLVLAGCVALCILIAKKGRKKTS